MEIADNLRFRIITVPTFALLKFVAYLDNPERGQDLGDLAHVLRDYEGDSERRFSSAVIDAEINYDAAGAFLLGQDLRNLCKDEEVDVVKQCLARLNDQYGPARETLLRALPQFRRAEENDQTADELLHAFKKGFE